MNLNYHSIVGILYYLAKTTRPNIVYATHQIAKYSSDPHEEHDEAIINLVNNLQCTCDLGLQLKPNWKKGFDCFCDTDFLGYWSKNLSPTVPNTDKTFIGLVIFYAACPIIGNLNFTPKWYYPLWKLHLWPSLLCYKFQYLSCTCWKNSKYTKFKTLSTETNMYWRNLRTTHGTWNFSASITVITTFVTTSEKGLSRFFQLRPWNRLLTYLWSIFLKILFYAIASLSVASECT